MADLMKIFESGPRIQAHIVNGVAKWVTFGESHMMALVEINGPGC